MESNRSQTVNESDVIKSLAEHFECLTDKRKARGLRYPLTPLLIIIVLAKLCEADDPMKIARWAKYRTSKLKKSLHLNWKRMPHSSTFRRVMQSAIDLLELEEVAGEYLSKLDKENSQLLNLDGKTLRGTIPKAETSGLHLLALQEAKQNTVVEQTALLKGENEISAAKRLLEKADLQGKIVTGDAIFAQRELSLKVCQSGGDYLWKVKANQGSLHKELERFFHSGFRQVNDLQFAKSLDKGHGRIEERILLSSSRFADQLDWVCLSQVFAIKREAIEIRTEKKSCQITYGITSLSPMDADATRLLELTRKHWGIENGLHYRRDVTFKEDACRMKSHTQAEVLAVCNNLTIGLIRHAGWDNVADARQFYSANIGQALMLILNPPS
jgi:predicted transposase YbfD/YdcC